MKSSVTVLHKPRAIHIVHRVVTLVSIATLILSNFVAVGFATQQQQQQQQQSAARRLSEEQRIIHVLSRVGLERVPAMSSASRRLALIVTLSSN